MDIHQECIIDQLENQIHFLELLYHGYIIYFEHIKIRTTNQDFLSEFYDWFQYKLS